MADGNFRYDNSYLHTTSRNASSQLNNQSFSSAPAHASQQYYGYQQSAQPSAVYPGSDFGNSRYGQQRETQPSAGYSWAGHDPNRAATGQNTDILSDNVSGAGTDATLGSGNDMYDDSGLGSLAYTSTLNYGTAAARNDGTRNSHMSSANASLSSIPNGTPVNQIINRGTSSYNQGPARTKSSLSGRRTPGQQARNTTQAPPVETNKNINLPLPSPSYAQQLTNYPTALVSRGDAAAFPDKPQRDSLLEQYAPASAVADHAYLQRAADSRSNLQGSVTHHSRSTPQQAAREHRTLPTPAAAQESNGHSLYQNYKPSTTGTQPSRDRATAGTYGPQQTMQQAPSVRTSQPADSPIVFTSAGTVNDASSSIGGQPARGRHNQPLRGKAHALQSTTSAQTQGQGIQPAKDNTQASKQRTQAPNLYASQAGSHTMNYSTAEVEQRPPSPPRPTTVDPNQVYNRQHEVRKQMEAANAEHARLLAARNAAEDAAAEASRAMEKEERQLSAAPRNEKDTTRPSAPSESDLAEFSQYQMASDGQAQQIASVGPAQAQEQAGPDVDPAVAAMEAEMKAMVEKMRAYQARDPKLFANVWESVKKTQNSKTAASPKVAAASTSNPATAPGAQAKLAPEKIPTVTSPNLASPVVALGQAVDEGAASMAPASAASLKRGPSDAFSESPGTPAKRKRVRPSRSKKAVAERAAAAAAERERALNEERANSSSGANVESQDIRAHGGSAAVDVTGAGLALVSGKAVPLKSAQGSMAGAATDLIDPRLMAEAGQSPAQSSGSNVPRTAPKPDRQPSLPVIPKKATVLWDPAHRPAMAIVAASVLNNLNADSGSRITAAEIIDMFAQNPSYPELCIMFEARGFKPDRARLAKTLLGVIPTAQGQTGSAQSSMSRSAEAQPGKLGASLATVPGHAEGGKVNQLMHAEANAYTTDEGSTAPVANSGKKLRGPYAKTLQRRGLLAPGVSPDSSKKPRGRPRKDGLAVGASMPNGGLQHGMEAWSNTFSPPNFVSAPQRNISASPYTPGYENPLIAKQQSTYQQINTAPPPKVAAPARRTPSPKILSKKELASKKRNFGELIAMVGARTGTESDSDSDIEIMSNLKMKPSQPPGQYQLAQAANVATTSPAAASNKQTLTNGAPAPPPAASLEHQAQPQQSTTLGDHSSSKAHSGVVQSIEVPPNPFKGFEDIVKPISPASALRKTRYDPRTVARDILITSSSHPTARGLNAHLLGLKAEFSSINDKADLSTFRWEVVDPGGPSPPGPSKMEHQSPLTVRSAMRPSRGGHEPRPRGRPPKNFYVSSIGGTPLTFDQSDEIMIVEKDSHKRRPGRPRGSTNRSIATSSRPAAPSTPISTSRRGRPVGWRPGDGNYAEFSARQRLSQSSRQQNHRYLLHHPGLQSFACRWNGCSSVLDNIDNLRRHCIKNHILDGEDNCSWHECGEYHNWTEETFEGHIERHLKDVEAELGPGASGSDVGTSQPRTAGYLNDANGRQVTPSVDGLPEHRSKQAADVVPLSNHPQAFQSQLIDSDDESMQEAVSTFENTEERRKATFAMIRQPEAFDDLKGLSSLMNSTVLSNGVTGTSSPKLLQTAVGRYRDAHPVLEDGEESKRRKAARAKEDAGIYPELYGMNI